MTDVADARFVVHHGDNMAILPTLADCSIDAIVTDPPAGIAFMGKAWDSDKGGRDAWIAWLSEVMGQCLRVLKPGGHALVWAIPRTSHWTGMAIENAGFEVRDRIAHCFGSGFPKSASVSKAIDRAAGVERDVIGSRPAFGIGGKGCLNGHADGALQRFDSGPATAAARQWQGWGTALKPAIEDWWLARKPLAGTVAANVMAHGTGALNIDACRIGDDKWEQDESLCALCAARAGSSVKPETPATKAFTATRLAALTLSGREQVSLADTAKPAIGCSDGMRVASTATSLSTERFGVYSMGPSQTDLISTTSMETRETTGSRICSVCLGSITSAPTGRWPANLIHSGEPEVLAAFPESSVTGKRSAQSKTAKVSGTNWLADNHESAEYADSGSAARFFMQCPPDEATSLYYTPKASRADRDKGNTHSTVKPIALMRYLCRLITPPDGVVLDPFAGSGSTGQAALFEGFRFIGIEADAGHVELARHRVVLAARNGWQPGLDLGRSA